MFKASLLELFPSPAFLPFLKYGHDFGNVMWENIFVSWTGPHTGSVCEPPV